MAASAFRFGLFQEKDGYGLSFHPVFHLPASLSAENQLIIEEHFLSSDNYEAFYITILLFL